MNSIDSISVRCRDIEKSYGDGPSKVQALRGIDLDIRRGELFMLVGPSGCGKTTLISIITSILGRDGGICDVFGHDPANMSAVERARFRAGSVGFVFQDFNLLPALTARENVSVPLLLNGGSQRNAEKLAEETLQTVGLGERASALPAQLSGGQQQRVAIARALVHKPKLIVCDEPTSNLDHKTGQAMMEILCARAKSSERVVIIVTHDPRIYHFADRVARMDDGKIIEILEGEETIKLS